MTAREFCDDDAGYQAWLASHPDGYVINILRSHNASQARVHHAGCHTIRGQNPRAAAWTGLYVKVCAQQLVELERWATDHVGTSIPPCGTCHRAESAARPNPTKPAQRAPGVPVPEGSYNINEPSADILVVQAWADDYIRFERRPAWQEDLRDQIRALCPQLEPSVGQIMHATFFGDKPRNADVENLALYNIDAFKVAGRNGIRFEHGAVVPRAPDGVEYPFCYRYALEPLSGTFDHWQPGRTLASFDWTDLGAFTGEKQPAQVWLALARRRADADMPTLAPDTPFAVKVEVRPPYGRQPRPDLLMKGILDGVIAAFQAHTDTAVLSDVAARLATVLPADTGEIEQHLLNQRGAVLGFVPQLVRPSGKSGHWNPADHWCVAGELFAAEPVDERWAITGELVELSR